MSTPGHRSDILTARDVEMISLKGKKPTQSIQVAVELRRSVHAREVVSLLEDIKTITKCDIIAHWDRNVILSFDIFGPGSGVDQAMKRLNDWIDNTRSKSKESSRWAKIPAFDPNKWYSEEVKELEMERKQRFRGPAPEEEPALYKITVDWPSELLINDTTPRVPFGSKLERLDPIRFRHEVYITLLDSRRNPWQVEIRGAEPAQIEAAAQDYRNEIERIRAERFGVPHEVTMILDVVNDVDVVFSKPAPWWPHSNNSVVPHLCHSLKEKPENFRQTVVDPVKVSQLQSSIQEAFAKVRHKKGSFDFAIRLGCIAISSGQRSGLANNSRIEINAFSKTVSNSNEIEVKKWIFPDQLGEKLLSRLMGAHDFLMPHSDAFGRRLGSLKETHPEFRGTWIFRNKNLAKNGNFIVVQILWTLDEDKKYEKTLTKYYDLEQPNPKDHMEVNLLEMDESRAWRFSLESMNSILPSKVSPLLRDFAKQVQMDPNHDTSSKKIFAQWACTGTISKILMANRLDKIYSFGVRDTGYIVEAIAMWYPGKALPCWGLTIRHSKWDNQLAALSTSSQANWGNIMAAFFPDDDEAGQAGISLLLAKMMQVSEMARSTDAQEGGVAI